MKRVLLAATLCALLVPVCIAQQTDADKPATKQDIGRCPRFRWRWAAV